ncbi:MAG: metal ABC transporter permease [Planctomycetota bacterium]
MAFLELANDYTVQVVVLGSAGIGGVSGALGCFAYLRRQSLMGDVVSHSSLLGIVLAFWLAFLITGESSRSLWVLMPGALLAGLASLLLSRFITRRTALKEDAGLGVMLAIFFGSGMMFLRYLQRSQPRVGGQSGLDQYLFGMAAAMTKADLWMIGVLGGLALFAMTLTWFRLKLITFDPQYAAGLGLRLGLYEVVLLSLLVIGIVIGLQIAGVVLMVSLLIAPASAARQWTSSLGSMVMLAAVIGAVTAASGAFISALVGSLPTGPVIVLLVTLVFLVSLIAAPGRGLIFRYRERRRVRVA